MININAMPAANMLAEQFIPDHLFVYVNKGAIECYDGNKTYTFKAGQYGIARKNRLARYKIADMKEGFEPVLFCFDEPYLKEFQQKYKIATTDFSSADTFINIKSSALMSAFIRSLRPYYEGPGRIAAPFEDLKYDELLFILLKAQPALAGLLFDYRAPEKIDLEAFMNKNFTFNISMERFAFLTGRSLSAFKRDFKAIFHQTPGRWLLAKRLQEAYVLITKKNKRPAEIYIDLGFETLSHFSFAFKQQFGKTPSEMLVKV